MRVYIYVLFLIPAFGIDGTAPGDTKNPTAGVSPEDVYRKLLKMKHAEQLKQLKNTILNKSYEKQFKVVKILMQGMLKVMIPSRVMLENNGYIPGDELPEKDEVKDALALVIENTILFCDILLRVPDISHYHLKRLTDADVTFKWGIIFTNETTFIDKTVKKLLNLSAQELDLIPRDANFVNPYKRKPEETVPQKPKKEKKRKEKKKDDKKKDDKKKDDKKKDDKKKDDKKKDDKKKDDKKKDDEKDEKKDERVRRAEL